MVLGSWQGGPNHPGIKGFCVSDIVMRLRKQSVYVDTATVYRALSVKGDNDKKRIVSVYTTYPEIFEIFC